MHETWKGGGTSKQEAIFPRLFHETRRRGTQEIGEEINIPMILSNYLQILQKSTSDSERIV